MTYTQIDAMDTPYSTLLERTGVDPLAGLTLPQRRELDRIARARRGCAYVDLSDFDVWGMLDEMRADCAARDERIAQLKAAADDEDDRE
ncbi:hypothetical protein C8E05_3817 [Rhodococcus wratislaviensis]|uniref:Uncharacterized protein n=1 Tax=Rhodococcus wratislaviensis TaxID=44752 RepID=A0AB38FKI7_RHOWR|nr:hypothetical protein [Rhodococcus wratislaviensis]REE74382.1 hypothetical protein C8E05_3817 [Rhodococcus wratislaviensis]SPZ42081.1 Uncharacterised protein [Rhodococcus wratislaviensis]